MTYEEVLIQALNQVIKICKYYVEEMEYPVSCIGPCEQIRRGCEEVLNARKDFNNNGVIIANEYAYGYNGILTKDSKMNISYVSYKLYNFVKSEKYKNMDF